ncbi:MAG TPA: thiamine-phosphate kinase, partial [Gemmatimonadales bacterium]|nr:thiamine-phosphate kinase [Gemmatimonadales bacterium]
MPAPKRRRVLGEFELLAKVRAAVEGLGRGHGVVVGIGDDCAVVRVPAGLQVLTTDTMVEGVHFRPAWLTPRELGVRAYRAAVSDVAAMGAIPRHALLSLELPSGGFDAADALSLVRGVAAEARRGGAALVGGNVSGGPRLSLTVTVTGEAVARPLLRRDAKPGDLVFVTGALGGAGAALCRLLAADESSSPRKAVPASLRAASAA